MALAHRLRANGLLTTVKTGTGTTLASYTYTQAGVPETGTLGDGSNWTRGHDELGRLTSIKDVTATGTTLLDDTYALDKVGNPITHRDTSGTSTPRLNRALRNGHSRP